MKDGIHPDYHTVVFLDTATGREWVSRSTMTASTTKELDGETVPVIHLDISAESHPYWTGQQRSLDTEGRVDRFNKRYAKKKA
jgi:large subunit ribosomal protein L31